MAAHGNNPNTPSTSAPLASKSDFWQYVPDPARTVLYILVAVGVFVAAHRLPHLAGQMEESRFQQEMRDARQRLAVEYKQWSTENPQQAHESAERWAQMQRQAEQEAEAATKLARPNTLIPMPMPMPGTSESTTPTTLN